MLVKWKDMIEKQTSRMIKELQIDNVERYKNQFLQFGQNNCTHFTNDIHRLAKKINMFFVGEGYVFVV